MRYVHCEVMRRIHGSPDHADYRCACGVIIEVYGSLIIDGYTGKEIEVSIDEEDDMTVRIPAGVTPYFRGPEVVYGHDRDGRNVEVTRTGVAPIFSIREKVTAYEDACELGFTEVAAKLGVPVSTLRRWKNIKPV